jgi:hypothetical protein
VNGSGTKASTANPSAVKKEQPSPAKPEEKKTASPIKKPLDKTIIKKEETKVQVKKS